MEDEEWSWWWWTMGVWWLGVIWTAAVGQCCRKKSSGGVESGPSVLKTEATVLTASHSNILPDAPPPSPYSGNQVIPAEGAPSPAAPESQPSPSPVCPETPNPTKDPSKSKEPANSRAANSQQKGESVKIPVGIDNAADLFDAPKPGAAPAKRDDDDVKGTPSHGGFTAFDAVNTAAYTTAGPSAAPPPPTARPPTVA